MIYLVCIIAMYLLCVYTTYSRIEKQKNNTELERAAQEELQGRKEMDRQDQAKEKDNSPVITRVGALENDRVNDRT